MPTNYGGRFIADGGGAARLPVWFPGDRRRNPQEQQAVRQHPVLPEDQPQARHRHRRRTSLTYEIKLPPGAAPRTGSGQTMPRKLPAALKKRGRSPGSFQPVWRPQGETRLEIQIPRSPNSGKRDEAQKAHSRRRLTSFKRYDRRH